MAAIKPSGPALTPRQREVKRREAERDAELEERGKQDPGAGFTRRAREESINTRYAVPPRPAVRREYEVPDGEQGE